MSGHLDLESLTADQERIGLEALDRMARGESVCHLDFPEMDPAEFDALMTALIRATNQLPEVH